MAYGNFCPRCTGIVDNNEFNFGKGICYECEENEKQKERREMETARLLEADAVQIEMGDILDAD